MNELVGRAERSIRSASRFSDSAPVLYELGLVPGGGKMAGRGNERRTTTCPSSCDRLCSRQNRWGQALWAIVFPRQFANC